MIDRADICLVHSHAKGDGGDHDGVAGRHEPLLDLTTDIILEPRMIGAGGQPGIGKPLGNLLGGLLQGDIDDGRGGWIVADCLEQDPVTF